VRVLVPGRESDVKTTYWAGRTSWQRLLDAGVRLYEYLPVMMHAKTLVVDGRWSAVGTMNFDNRSMAFNDETMLLAYDGEVGARLEAMFEADLHWAREVDARAFRRRPLTERAHEQAAALLSRWL
jgi:cardiolipin synthase